MDKKRDGADIEALQEEIATLKNALETVKSEISDAENFKIIYPNGGTEEVPATIKTNMRVVEDNPFPGYYVMCHAQIKKNDSWGWAGWHTANAYGRFVNAEQLLPEDKIVIQSGSNTISGENYYDGSPFGEKNVITSAPFRVLVFKLGKIEE